MKNCCVCEKENSAYKCPTCRQFYCSVSCCKGHKQEGCEPPTEPEKSSDQLTKPAQHYDYPTEDTVALEKLGLLKDSNEVKECLKNRHVRDIINAILNDSDPTKAIGLAMTEPIFVELADACLRVVEPQDEQTPS